MIYKRLEKKDFGKVTTPKSANLRAHEGGGENAALTTPSHRSKAGKNYGNLAGNRPFN